jgi:hypothetical protein
MGNHLAMETIKESWLECAPFLFEDFPEKENILQCARDKVSFLKRN